MIEESWSRIFRERFVFILEIGEVVGNGGRGEKKGEDKGVICG